MALVAVLASVFGLACNPVPASAAGPAAASPVVVVGVPGLRWDDLSPAATPNLWRLAGRSGLANMTTYTVSGVTCPADGWLTVSAGQRASLDGSAPAVCAPPPSMDFFAETFAKTRKRNLHGKYAADIGLLGTQVRRAGGRTLAVGPGAALGVADERGAVDAYAATPSDVPTQEWARATLTAVDLEQIETTPPDGRAGAVRQADRSLGAVLAAIPPGARVLVAGVSDTTRDNFLHVATAGPRGSAAYLTSASTRRDGLVTLTDLTATVLSDLKIPLPRKAIGRAWKPTGGAVSVAGAVRRLADDNTQARVSDRSQAPFWYTFVGLELVLYAWSALALCRPWARRAVRRRVLAVTRVAALCAGALPLAIYVVNLVPWWRSPAPVPVMLAWMAGFDAVIVGVALAGPWRRSVIIPGTVVTGLTTVVFAADVMTGAWLQWDSATSYNPIVAGRFYGFGNIAYAIFAAAVLLFAAGLAQPFLDRGRRGRAAAVAVTVGVVAEVITAWPGWGAKFGGTIALVPGIAVTALMLAGRRVSAARLLGFCAAGVVVIGAFAFVDYLRPASKRTHLGQFVGQVFDGEAATVVRRKIGAMLGTVGHSWQLTLLTVVAALFLWLVLLRRQSWRGPALAAAGGRAPALRAGVAGACTAAVVGFLTEDSGISVPALALAVAVPLALSACARALEDSALPDVPEPVTIDH